jgi:hypothetical protein
MAELALRRVVAIIARAPMVPRRDMATVILR